MASIKKIKGGYILKIRNSQAQIISDLGCNLNKLVLDDIDIIDGNISHDLIKKNYLAKSAFLIPFPNRINNGKYNFEGKSYQLKKNHKKEGHAIHGLVFDKKFILSDKSVSNSFVSATFKYKFDKKNKGYPFGLLITINFKLSFKRLIIKVKADNLDSINLPYGIGWHPYLKPGGLIDNHILNISSKKVFLTRNMIPTLKIGRKTLDGKLGKTFLDNGFLGLKKPEIKINKIIVFQDKTMKFLQVYTPSHRQSIAIEPMSCAPDAFNNKIGLIVLKPNKSISHTFGIKL